MPKAYIIARRAISYRRYITRSKRNGYHCKKPLLSGRQKRFFTWCRWPDSNRHAVASGGFWVHYVYQFHHTGRVTGAFRSQHSYYNLLEEEMQAFFAESREIFQLLQIQQQKKGKLCDFLGDLAQKISAQALHDPLFQTGNIRLGDAQEVCHFLLRFFFPAL